jgi:hypothetical protein
VAHLSGAVGFILLAFGLLALRLSLPEGPGARAARAALATTGFGVGLTLLYYGAETFALHEIGRRALAPGAQPVGELVDQIRNGPAQLTVFGLGLLLVAAGGVLAAVAAWRSGRLRRWSGIPLAAGLVLYLPQFFAPPAARIAHGLLMAVGCLALAAGLRLAEAHRAGTVSPSAEPRSR